MKNVKKYRIDRSLYPEVWSLNLTEISLLFFIKKHIQMRPSLKKYTCLGTSFENTSDLLLPRYYVYNFRKIHKCYYSPKERLIVAINRYLYFSDIEDFIAWTADLESTYLSFAYLLIYIVSFDDYIKKSFDADLLKKCQMYSEKLQFIDCSYRVYLTKRKLDLLLSYLSGSVKVRSIKIFQNNW